MTEQQPDPGDELLAAAGVANSATLALRWASSMLAGDTQAWQREAKLVEDLGVGTAVAAAAVGLLVRLLQAAERRGWLGDMTAARWCALAAARQLDEAVDIDRLIDGEDG